MGDLIITLLAYSFKCYSNICLFLVNYQHQIISLQLNYSIFLLIMFSKLWKWL
nr:MAG TPA: hypothetical protein [Caudoviricetes sp.]